MTIANYATTRSESLARQLRTYDTQEDLTSGVITTAPRKLVEFTGVNGSGSTRYIMVFDLDAVPANGTVPKVSAVPVAAAGTFTYTPPGGELQFDNGICWASSSTRTTLTITMAADVWLTAAHI